MAILSKACKPDNFESHNSQKLSFTNIGALCSNFVDCESFLESISPDILALCDQASDLWEQLELAFELESVLQDVVDWGRKWHAGMLEKLSWFCLTSLLTLVLLM